jgi:hypothetical protein
MKLQIAKIDPLLCDFEMSLRAVYYPLGFSLEIATNSAGILEAAEESWGHFEKVFPGPTLQLRIGVVEDQSGVCPPEPTCREQHNLLARVADAGNFSVSDLQQGFAFAWLTQAAVEHRPYMRWHFIEGMTWDLLGSRYITSVHAACVKLGEQGLLLCGDSGAGKSTLSYACARQGWTYLSDDSCCLVRGRNDRMVIGNPYQIRFREATVGIFPELDQHRRTPHNGEMAIELATAVMPEIKTTLSCSVDYILFLNRGAFSKPELVPFPKDTALQWFEQIICSGVREIREAHKSTLRNLLTAEILELRYNDLASAVELLDTLVLNGAHPLAESKDDLAKAR